MSDQTDQWVQVDRVTARYLEVTPKKQVGTVLFSEDTTPAHKPMIPLTDLAGWLVEEVHGVMLVVDER